MMNYLKHSNRKNLAIMITLLSLLLGRTQGNGQTMEPLSALSIHGPKYETINDMTADHEGNLYLTGNYGEGADLNPGAEVQLASTNGSSDIFVQKLNADGELLWTKVFGGPGYDKGTTVLVNEASEIYIMGVFRDSMDIDPGSEVQILHSAGKDDLFVLKLDGQGQLLWAQRIGNDKDDLPVGLALDNAGGLFVAGSFQGAIDLNPGPGQQLVNSTGWMSLFVAKLQASGEFGWAKLTGGSFGADIITDQKGHLYIMGSYYGTTDFDPSTKEMNLTSFGEMDAFVQKLDNKGNLIWVKSFGGKDLTGYHENGWHEISGKALAIDNDGNIYLGGNFREQVDFDPGPEKQMYKSKGLSDVFVSKFDAKGEFIWAKAIGASSEDQLFDMAIDSKNQVHLTGKYDWTIDFDPGPNEYPMTPASPALSDAFVLTLNEKGGFVGAYSIGGKWNDRGTAITIDPAANIYIAGHYKAALNFNIHENSITLEHQGNTDIFLLKMTLK